MIHICEYGCGREGKYQFKNGRWCCSEHSQKCPSLSERTGKKNKGKKHKTSFKSNRIENSNHICEYGCGR